MARKRKRPTPQRKHWQKLQRAYSDPELYARHGMSLPDRSYRNDQYNVVVRVLNMDYEGKPLAAHETGLHLSIHRLDRKPIRDWRHLQAIKNEVAGPERTAIELFPPESQLVDTSNEFHLWVLPTSMVLPFVIPERLVLTPAEGRAMFGTTAARQREWQPGITTGIVTPSEDADTR